MVKQLSNARPTRKRHTQKAQKVVTKAVAIPAMNPIRLVQTSAGILPYRSAIHPKISPPRMAPPKNTACAIVGNAALSQTHPSCKYKMSALRYKLPILETQTETFAMRM